MSAVLVGQVATPRRAHLRLVVDNGPAHAPVQPNRAAALAARALLGVVGLVLAIVFGVLVGLVLRPESPVGTTVVTVSPGESLWSVAAAVAEPGDDPRELVERIVALNGLSEAVLHPGQHLIVPGA